MPDSTGATARLVDYLRNERLGAEVSLGDVMRLAEVAAESFQAVFETLDRSLCRDLGDMAREIASMKREIATLRLAEVQADRIPAAGRELDAIVEATEAATDTIMTAAEAIMAADPAAGAPYRALVEARIVEIFEACSFQDITGQRISKVVATLNHLDARISILIARLKLPVADEPPEETDGERRQRDRLLQGPQVDGHGVSQDDVDALLR